MLAEGRNRPVEPGNNSSSWPPQAAGGQTRHPGLTDAGPESLSMSQAVSEPLDTTKPDCFYIFSYTGSGYLSSHDTGPFSMEHGQVFEKWRFEPVPEVEERRSRILLVRCRDGYHFSRRGFCRPGQVEEADKLELCHAGHATVLSSKASENVTSVPVVSFRDDEGLVLRPGFAQVHWRGRGKEGGGFEYQADSLWMLLTEPVLTGAYNGQARLIGMCIGGVGLGAASLGLGGLAAMGAMGWTLATTTATTATTMATTMAASTATTTAAATAVAATAAGSLASGTAAKAAVAATAAKTVATTCTTLAAAVVAAAPAAAPIAAGAAVGAAAAATTLLRGCAANRNDEDGKVGCAVSSARLIIRDKEGGAFAKEVRGEDLRWPWEWQPSVHRPDTDVVGLLARALVSYQPSKEGKEAGEVRLRATVEQLRKEISAASNDMVADMAEVLSGGAKQKALEAIAGSEDAHDEVLQQVVSQMPPCCGAGGTVPGTHIERMMLATQTGGANRIVVLHPTIRAYICRTSSANDLTK